MTTRKPHTSDEVHAAVRLDKATGAGFVDLSTVAYSLDGARLKAKEGSASWRDANPVQRFGRFRLEEMPR